MAKATEPRRVKSPRRASAKIANAAVKKSSSGRVRALDQPLRQRAGKAQTVAGTKAARAINDCRVVKTAMLEMDSD